MCFRNSSPRTHIVLHSSSKHSKHAHATDADPGCWGCGGAGIELQGFRERFLRSYSVLGQPRPGGKFSCRVLGFEALQGVRDAGIELQGFWERFLKSYSVLGSALARSQTSPGKSSYRVLGKAS